MTVYVPLDRLRPNRWQPRQYHDPVWVAEVAASIAELAATMPETLGLLQVPAARLVDTNGTPATLTRPTVRFHDDVVREDLYVELAYGHTRAEAFRHLAATDAKRWGRLPLTLVVWSNEQMAKTAWFENNARKDLTPLEEAQYIARVMQDFGWTQQQVAAHLKLDRTTVANKLRLLKLPPDAQALLATSALSERQAQALVALADLPPQALARAEKEWEKPSKLLAEAPLLSSDAIRDRVHRVVNVATRDLKLAHFPLDEDTGATEMVSPTCTGCPIRVRRGDEQRCPDYGCWERKAEVWKERQLQAASAALGGVPIADEQTAYRALTPLGNATGTAIQQAGCNRLHVQWNAYGGGSIDGFPRCRLVCVHGEGRGVHCACEKRLLAAQHAADPEKHARMECQQQAQAMIDQGAAAVYAALTENELGVWRALAAKLDYELDIKKAAALDLHACQQVVARCLVAREVYVRPDVDKVRDELARVLDAMAVPRPWERPTLADIERTVAGIEGWLVGPHAEPPTVDALQENAQHLDDLVAQVPTQAPGAHQVYARMMRAQVDIRHALEQAEHVCAHTPELAVEV